MRYYLLLCLLCVLTYRVLSHSCNSAQQCTATSLVQNSFLVQCIDNQCVCESDCFFYDFYVRGNITDTCIINSVCYSYSSENDTCYLITKSANSAVIYALFLGYVGGANYYIGRYDQAIIQTILFLILVPFSLLLCALNVYCCRGHKRRSSLTIRWFICNCIGVVIVVLLSVVLFIWWIVDIFLFANNMKLDGNQCSLSVS
ncbi:hypothetical protein LOD99_2538 [Oopsacas minuta]|uniref:Uncharacterized protein n=1 Tax=Oopsacas minuta TaxID=111878 RepID=A0AAV7K388_9METZ|nr:hypothetical protein LOD99_2538 [Oopsacas minuta]